MPLEQKEVITETEVKEVDTQKLTEGDVNTQNAPKKRGRPPKPKDDTPKDPKKRGRPPKPKEPKKPKKRGRPKKDPLADIPLLANRPGRRPSPENFAKRLANIEKPYTKASMTPPQMAPLMVRPEIMKKALQDTIKWRSMPSIRTDEEAAERLNLFFRTCSQGGEYPTVEKMCLALGYDVDQVLRWEKGNGCSPERSAMIKKAKSMLKSLDAELVNSSNIPVVSYIFRAKNFYDMHDDVRRVEGTESTERIGINELLQDAAMLPVKSAEGA